MHKKLVVVLAVLAALCTSVALMAQQAELEVKLAKAIEQENPSKKTVIEAIIAVQALPREFLTAHFDLLKNLKSQDSYVPAEVIHAFVEFVPVYNKYYSQEEYELSLRSSLFQMPINTKWKKNALSINQLLRELEIEYVGSGDAFKYRTAEELQQKWDVKDPLEAAIFADFATRVLQEQYATAPAPELLYNAYVVLEQDLLKENSVDNVGVIKALAKFAPAYLDFYTTHSDEAIALSEGLFKEKFVTGWASRYQPTTLRDMLASIEIEMLAGGDAYRYRTVEELVRIYQKAGHKKDRLTKEEAESFVDFALRALQGKYYREK